VHWTIGDAPIRGLPWERNLGQLGLTREEHRMHRDQLKSNGKQARKSVKRASSADWRTEDLHSLWQRTGTIQLGDAPYPLHEFLRYCLLLQTLRRKFEHDDQEHQFDACAFFLCGGYFAFKYLNLTSSMRLRGTIFGGLRHAAQPQHEFATFIAELREKARTTGKQQVELFVCEEVKSGTGMGRVMRIIKDSMEAASDECAFSVEFYAIRPGTADQMSDHLRSTGAKWQGDHKTPTGTLRINITHFAGSLPTYDTPILRGLDVASTSQDDEEAYEMLKLSDGTLSFWCEQNQRAPVIQIPIQDNCLVEMMSACAVSWTTKSKSILTRTLERAIASRSCQVCKALLQKIVRTNEPKVDNIFCLS
jgi:hypothetical protein